jgi:predicted O-methyltransferase YrrM
MTKEPELKMPDLMMPAVPRNGRWPREGYQRGWGLQFGSLKDQVRSHPLFLQALQAADGRSILEPSKLENLFVIIASFLRNLTSQDVVEFGVFRGGSSLFMATLLAELYPDARIYCLDTFDGMPETDKRIDAHSKGDFKDADLSGFHERIRHLGLKNMEIVEGSFEDTFPTILERRVKFALAHIDCDIYSAVKYSQDAVWDHMVPGGYLVFDDATTSSCMGATQAVEELIMRRRLHSEQIWPHFVFRANLAETL